MHALLILLNVVSLFFVCQIDIGILPLLDSNLEIERIRKINDLISNISHGVIVSSLFYFLLVYTPEIRKKIAIRSIIQNRLDILFKKLQIALAYYMAKHAFKSHTTYYTDISGTDISNIVQIKNAPMHFKYSLKNKNNESVCISTGEVTEIDFFNMERENVIKTIDEILRLPTIIYEECELLKLLTRLRDGSYYTAIEGFKLFGEDIIASDFKDGFIDYYEQYKKLYNYVNKTPIQILDN